MLLMSKTAQARLLICLAFLWLAEAFDLGSTRHALARSGSHRGLGKRYVAKRQQARQCVVSLGGFAAQQTGTGSSSASSPTTSVADAGANGSAAPSPGSLSSAPAGSAPTNSAGDSNLTSSSDIAGSSSFPSGIADAVAASNPAGATSHSSAMAQQDNAPAATWITTGGSSTASVNTQMSASSLILPTSGSTGSAPSVANAQASTANASDGSSASTTTTSQTFTATAWATASGSDSSTPASNSSPPSSDSSAGIANAAASVASTSGPASTMQVGIDGKKAGLGWIKESGSDGAAFMGSGSQVGWTYSWNEALPSNPLSGVKFLPMLWGAAAEYATAFTAASSGFEAMGVTHLLSLNEPDGTGGGGSNAPVASAVAAHQAVFGKPNDTKFGNYQVSTPAVTNGNDTVTPKGIPYLSQWIEQCNAAGGCKYDFFPIHYYGIKASDFQDYLVAWKNKFLVGDDAGKYLLITEYGCKQYGTYGPSNNLTSVEYDTPENTLKFHQDMIKWFNAPEQESWIAGWSNEGAVPGSMKGFACNENPNWSTPMTIDDPNQMISNADTSINSFGQQWMAMS